MMDIRALIERLRMAGCEPRVFSAGRLIVLVRNGPIDDALRAEVNLRRQEIADALADADTHRSEPEGLQATLFDVAS